MPRDCVTWLSRWELLQRWQCLPQASPSNSCIMCIPFAKVCEKVTPNTVEHWRQSFSWINFLSMLLCKKKRKRKKADKKQQQQKSHEVLLVSVCFDPGTVTAWDSLQMNLSAPFPSPLISHYRKVPLKGMPCTILYILLKIYYFLSLISN